MKLLSVCSYPQAILHIDGDAFFASCCQAINPQYRNKPLVTGAERGIATAISYEARKFGIKRGMTQKEIKKLCPQCIIAASDYQMFSLFSLRMHKIVKKYTPQVEEYSIDECFADISGLRRSNNCSYEKIAEKIKKELEESLNISFSLGLASSKVLAKIASNYKKPSGLVNIPGKKIHLYLKNLPLQEIWGIGPQTAAFLKKKNIKNALEFVYQDEGWIKKNLNKPYWEIWKEMHGQSIYPVEKGKKEDYQSVSKTQTFTPPIKDKNILLARLCKNTEKACAKLRRHKLATKQIHFFLKTQQFSHFGIKLKLMQATNTPERILEIIDKNFDKIYKKNTLYRATGVVLQKLVNEEQKQMNLFLNDADDKMEKVYKKVDLLNDKFGQNTIFMGRRLGKEVKKSNRKINYPYLGTVV